MIARVEAYGQPLRQIDVMIRHDPLCERCRLTIERVLRLHVEYGPEPCRCRALF
jgi:hypothetical protein